MEHDYPILRSTLQKWAPPAVKIENRSMPQSAVIETLFPIALKATL